MKITSVDLIQLKGKYWDRGWRPTIVKVNTDEGIYGYGEVGLAYGNAQSAALGIVKDFSKLIIGMDPTKIDAIWDKLHKQTFWGLGGGTVIFGGISAIDIALWDIKGKMLNVPVYQLLGGKTNEKVRAYASQIQFGWDDIDYIDRGETEDYVEQALRAVAEGYDAIKVDPLMIGKDGIRREKNTGILAYDNLKVSVDRMEAIRKAVGPKVDIIVENHTGTDTNSAIQFANAIKHLNIFYNEEVCTPLNPELTKKVKEKVDIPLAGGERIYTRWGFRPFFENGSLDVIQPDLGTCGGISEGKKICDMAHTYDVLVQLHICGSPIIKAASLQLEAAIPNIIIHEHHRRALLPANIEFCVHNYQPVNGFYNIPDLPGIGQELTKEAIKNSFVETIS